MEQDRRKEIDRLVLGSDHEVDKALARQAYRKAVRILRSQESTGRQGINWTSDDDPILRVRQKAVSYISDAGSCKLLLTNFHRKVPVDKIDGTISIEIFPPEAGDIDYKYRNGELLFTFDRHGVIQSPLGLVDAETAESVIDLFCEEQEAQAA